MELISLWEKFASGDLFLVFRGHDDGREKMRFRSFVEIGILPNHLAASSNHVPNLALRLTEASHHDAVFVL
jgi:hypothetical protein